MTQDKTENKILCTKLAMCIAQDKIENKILGTKNLHHPRRDLKQNTRYKDFNLHHSQDKTRLKKDYNVKNTVLNVQEAGKVYSLCDAVCEREIIENLIQ